MSLEVVGIAPRGLCSYDMTVRVRGPCSGPPPPAVVDIVEQLLPLASAFFYHEDDGISEEAFLFLLEYIKLLKQVCPGALRDGWAVCLRLVGRA